MERIGIIGAGPAGIIAAGMASLAGKEVYLFEKNNRIGRKLYITGKGRCNITNAAPIDEFFDYIVSNKSFLYSSLYSFTNEDTIILFNKLGLKTKVERGNRVFPESDKSSDVIKVFMKFLDDSKVRLLLDTQVKSIERQGNKFIVSTNKNSLVFDKIIITTGGVSYPLTGSTGDGYKFAEKFGHTIVSPKPSLVPIEVKEDWIKDLQGLSLKNVSLKSTYKGKIIHEEFGEMLFTHFGISGPIVLTTSNFIHNYLGKDIKFSIDFKPALDYEKLDNRMLRDFKDQPNKLLKNSLNGLLPQRIIPLVIEISQIDPEKNINQIRKDERTSLINIIKNFPLTYKSLRPIKEAIITSGGVSTKEINPSTMESKIVKNLYFAGEIIDVHALTGGFNLQIAYSTGYLAGTSV